MFPFVFKGNSEESQPISALLYSPRALLTGIFDEPDDFDEPDPDRLRECSYWRCGELFEARTANQIFCRKACRSRQRKWERAVERRARKRRSA